MVLASTNLDKQLESVQIVLELAWLHMVRREGGEYGGWQSIILSTVTKASDEMVCYDAYTLLGPREQGFAKCPHSSAKTSPDNTEEEIDRPTSNNQKPEPWKLVSSEISFSLSPTSKDIWISGKILGQNNIGNNLTVITPL